MVSTTTQYPPRVTIFMSQFDCSILKIRACFGAFVWRACGEIAREDSLLEITLFQAVGTLKTGGKVNKREADSLYN